MAVRSLVIGAKYGRLTVVREADPIVLKNGQKASRSLVKCECDAEIIVRNSDIKTGNTTSCGCLRKQKHRNTLHPEYWVWAAIKTRCTNMNYRQYADYGGRGIVMCERWKNSFAAFLEDMGPRPSSEHSIERKNNDGNYELDNCRWATRLEQANNTRTNHMFTFYEKTMTMTQWCRIAQINPQTVISRLKSGWSEKKAFWTPARVKVRHRTQDS